MSSKSSTTKTRGPSMPWVTIDRDRNRLTLPDELWDALNVTDEAELEATVIEEGVLLKSVPEEASPEIDAEIAEGLADIRAGRSYGPFESVEDMKAYFKQHPLHED